MMSGDGLKDLIRDGIKYQLNSQKKAIKIGGYDSHLAKYHEGAKTALQEVKNYLDGYTRGLELLCGKNERT
jgi:hypothetical protein